MRIGIEVQRLFRRQKFGIETSALELIKSLQKVSPKNEFFIYAKEDTDRSCLSDSPNTIVRTLSGKIFIDFEQFFLPLAAKGDRLDILHCTGNTRPFFSPVPLVQTLHDVIFMDPISLKDSLYQQFGNYYRRHLVPLVTGKSNAVITVSHYEKERILKRIKIDERKVRVIYNGIDEKRFTLLHDLKKAEEVKRRYNLPPGFILFIGNTAARKNAIRVIDAYTRYASGVQKPLPIVTPGLPKEFIKSKLAAINQLAKQKYFVSPGYIEDADLPFLYNLSTVFLYPSLAEGFGMPLVEAMACGAPVITSNTSCLPEIAGDAAILTDPMNIDSIANAIKGLSNNEDLRIRKITEGFSNAKRFNWTKTAEQVYEIYEEVWLHSKRTAQESGKMQYGLQ